MRALRLLVGLTIGSAAIGQTITPYFSQDFSTNGGFASWQTNGAPGSNGLYTSAGVSSLMSNVAVPAGSSDYEVRVTYRLTQSGGSYLTYSAALPTRSCPHPRTVTTRSS